jgi:creatinine amidohydrolase
VTTEFADLSWLEIEKAIERDTLIILPVGMLEQHGPHLPVATDSIIADHISRGAADRLQARGIPALVLPIINTGYTGRRVADPWPGAVSVEPETLVALAYDVLDSVVRMGFRKIAIINGHGQNPAMLEIAIRRIADTHDVSVVMMTPHGMIGADGSEIRQSELGGCGGHADEYETSVMLYLRPELVDMTKATDVDRVQYHSPYFPGDMFASRKGGAYWSAWAVNRPKLGMHGDPTTATAETGRRFVEAILSNCVEFLIEYYNFGRDIA